MFQALNQSNLTYDVAAHMINCSQNQQCQQLFTASVNFVNIVTKIFARPFPQLGTMITFFAANVFTDNGFDYEMNMIEEKSHNFLAALLREYYPNENFTVSLYDLYAWGSFQQTLYNKPKYSLSQTDCSSADYSNIYYSCLDYSKNTSNYFPCADKKNPCCNLLTKYLIGNHLEQFMKMMKYSQINNDFMNQIDSAFLSKFIDNSKLFYINPKIVLRKQNTFFLLSSLLFPSLTNTDDFNCHNNTSQSWELNKMFSRTNYYFEGKTTIVNTYEYVSNLNYTIKNPTKKPFDQHEIKILFILHLTKN